MRQETKKATLTESLSLLMVIGLMLWSVFTDLYANQLDAGYFDRIGATAIYNQWPQDQTARWSDGYAGEWYGTSEAVNMASPPEPTYADGQMTPQQQFAHAQADLADRLGLDPAEVNVISSGPVTWRSGALGCPKPGMNYTQALVPGFRIILQAEKTTYHYHAKSGGQPFHCPQDRIETPSSSSSYE
jgi:hypothetical protein